LHGVDYADTPLRAGIYMLPLTVGMLIAAGASLMRGGQYHYAAPADAGVLGDTDGAEPTGAHANGTEPGREADTIIQTPETLQTPRTPQTGQFRGSFPRGGTG